MYERIKQEFIEQVETRRKLRNLPFDDVSGL